jgi:membrane fusion protein (multidrug efflux system)
MQGIHKIKLFGPLGVIAAGMMLMSGCGAKTNTGTPSPPPEVGVVVVQLQRVALTTELSGRTSPGCRGPAAGQRHHPEAGIYRGE